MRCFEKISLKLDDDDVVLPKRSTSGSAGYDFFSPDDYEIPANGDVLIKTGIKAKMMSDECLFIYPRSSIGIKHNIMLQNTVGVVDSDYYNNKDNEGEIMVSLRNLSNQNFLLKKGERFCQGIFQKVLLTNDDTSKGEREGGIGSTGN